MDFPDNLQNRRTKLGLSQAALGAAAGINARQVRSYEAGEHQPSLSTLVALAAALRTSVGDLIGETTQQRTSLSGTRTLAWQDGDEIDCQPIELEHSDDRVDFWNQSSRGILRLWERSTLTGWYLQHHGRVLARGALYLQLADGIMTGRWVGPGRAGGTTTGRVAIAATELDARAHL